MQKNKPKMGIDESSGMRKSPDNKNGGEVGIPCHAP
jgi:hypothetical protein